MSLNEATEAPIDPGHLSDKIVHNEQGYGRDGAPGERCVRASHCVLNRVGEKQEQSEVERGHLADLPLAAEADSDQHQEIDDTRPQGDFQQRVPAGERHAQFWVVAVTGIGAFLGVLRYPVILFLSTVQTTNS